MGETENETFPQAIKRLRREGKMALTHDSGERPRESVFPVSSTGPTSSRRADVANGNGDAMNLRVSLRDVIQLIVLITGLLGVYYGVRGDINDLQKTVNFNMQLQAQERDATKDSISELKRLQQLQSYDISEMKLALARAGIYKGGDKP